MRISPKLPLVLALAAMGVVVFSLNSTRKQEVAEAAPVTVPTPAPVAAAAGEAPRAGDAAALPPTDPIPTAPEDELLFSDLGNLEKGTIISLPLPDGSRISASVNYSKTHSNDATAAGGVLVDGSGTFEIAREPWGYRGRILQDKVAHVYSSDADGKLHVARRPKGEVICEPDPNFKPIAQAPREPQHAAIYNGGRSVGILYEPIPILHSLPRAAATMYLDFDGEVIEGQSWEGGRRIIASAFNLTATEVTDIWRRVAEDFEPYEVNVTTDLQAYLRAPQGRRMRCIFTPDNFAPGSGGIAFSGTFLESGDTCCWVFMTGKAGSDAASHEIGHTLGLHHDATATSGYYGGQGNWGPIMGAPYGYNLTQWSKGEYPGASEQQDDLLVMGSYVPRRPDDHMPTLAEATPLTLGAGGAVSNSGVIDSTDDIDAFTFTTTGGAVNLQFNGAVNSPNLDIEVKLYNAAGTLLTTSSPTDSLGATLSQSLVAGTYRITVDGVGNGAWNASGYGDYGSLGAYTITGTIAGPQWTFRVPVNALTGAVLGTVAPGTGSGFSITGGNTGGAFSISAGGVLTVATPAALASNTSFSLTVAYTSGGSPTTTTVPVTVAKIRGLKQEIWTGLGGNGIGPMTSLGTYPNNPNQTRYAPIFQTTLNLDNYGQKVSGYLVPTETGNHTFWISSDDYSEVWLSPDSNPLNKVKIITLSAVTGAGTFTNPAQQSAAISLTAGQRYYMEVLHRDQTGQDHMAVAWQTPTQARHYIPSANLEYPGTLPNRAPWIAAMTYRVREDAAIGASVATISAGDFEPGSVLGSYSITAGNTGNAFALNATTGALTVNGPLSFATLQKYLLTVQTTDSGGLTTSVQIAVEIEPLAVKRQVWTGIGGNTLNNLTSLGTYPNNPNSTSYLRFFETPTNAADNFGQKLSGYLRAPDTGNYTFWIASDDEGELWLSSDTNPANKTRIAYTATATASREWGKFATQKSATISLTGGKFYYIEAINKEGTGGDNLAVSWSGPDFGQRMLGTPNVTQLLYNHGGPVLDDKNVTVFSRDGIITTLEAKDWSDPGTQVTYAITGGNTDGAFIIDPLTGVIRRNPDLTLLPVGTRVLTVTATDNGPTPLTDTATITVNVLKVGMKREVWTGISGTALTDLTGSIKYPYQPDFSGYASNFQVGGYSDNQGQRLSGFLVPPTSGSYVFWIASDDEGELWISSDANPANKKKIAYVTGWVNSQQWGAQGNQQSIAISLEAGHHYYIEALQKNGTGGDHLAVAWQGPGISQAVIPSSALEYPDSLRPGLKREFYNSSSTTKWANNPSTGQMEWSTAAANLTEGFAGTGALNGNTADTGTGTWGASTGWARNNGVATKAAGGDAHALLPFAPQPGYVYTLSLEIDPTNSPGSADWFALGFTSEPTSNTAIYTQTFLFPNVGQSWLLARANGNSSGTMTAFSSALANPVNVSPSLTPVGTYDTLSIVLDTRAPAWVSTFFLNGNLQATHNHPGSLPIRSVGFSSYGNAVGNVRNFRVTSTGTGIPGTLPNAKAKPLTEENFSERLTGYIVPPATGGYTFWIASDDDGQLLLSTDENPANLAPIASVTGYVAEEAWEIAGTQKSAVKQLVAGKRYYLQVNHRDGSFGDHVTLAWEGPGFDRQVISNAYLETPSAPADRTRLQREVWTGIGGTAVANLTSAATYPASPATTAILAEGAGFTAPVDTADDFGSRVSGYIVAPDDGRYTFWIASDEDSELWLSTDSNPTNRIKIASVSGAVSSNAWDVQLGQKSAPIALLTGRRYYIEALHKDGTSGDHLSVAWQGPGFDRRVISNLYLENPLTIPANPGLKREVWSGVTGTAVVNLTSNSAFTGGRPTGRGILTTFESPASFADNFGERVTGHLVPPETGNYKFWIAANDTAELWLSTDTNPANRVRIAAANAVTAPRTYTTFAAQESGWLPLTAGQRYHIEVLHKEGTLVDHMSVAWQGPSFSRQIIDGRFLEYPGTVPAPAYLKREVWTGIGGNNVTDLTGNSVYQNTPNQTQVLSTFETPANSADNYGQRVSGYFIAPVAGSYQFWIASDDGGELWLATNGVPGSKTRIAFTNEATGSKNWTKFPSQASAAINLTAGQRCYIEALHKEGGGEDYLAVAFQGPGISQRVIGSQFLEYPGLHTAPTQSGAAAPATGLDNGYNFWLAFNNLSGGANRPTGADPDGDGIPNSLEFILGGKPSGTGADSTALLPKYSTDGDFAVFEFRRADVAQGVNPFAQFSTTLGAWTRATNGVAGVQILTEDDGYGRGVDKVTVRVPKAGVPTLFLRLNSNMQ